MIDLRLIIKDIESEMSYAVAEEINNAETINATHVVHGKWVDKCARDWHCSACGKPSPIQFDGYCVADQLEYCARCGAKMDERGEIWTVLEIE